MFTIATYPYPECALGKCKKSQHGYRIVEAITRSRSSDDLLVRFVAKACRNFARVTDAGGGSALHCAAEYGRYAIVEWLIKQGADVNLVTKTGQSPMHFALKSNHLQVAVLLQRYGASVDILDNQNHIPLNFCHNVFSEVKTTTLETLVWGSNKNYNLGLGNEEGRELPQQVEFFKKEHTSVKAVAISSFHSLYIDEMNQLYAVGHGNEFQLGIGKKGTLVLPQKIHISLRKQDYPKAVSVSQHHSLVLTARGHVYSCGSDDFSQLGCPTNKSSQFCEVRFLDLAGPIKGVIASEFHSIAYNDTHVYVWGTHVGQFGPNMIATNYSEPRTLSSHPNCIHLVASSRAAIAVATMFKQVLIFANEKVRSVKTPTVENIQELMVIGGKANLGGLRVTANNSSNDEELKMVVRTVSGIVFVWFDTLKQYLRCEIPMPGNFINTQLTLSGGSLIYVNCGRVYIGELTLTERPQLRNKRRDDYQMLGPANKKELHVKPKRVPLLNAVETVVTDEIGKSFVALQQSAKRFLDIPKEVENALSFKSLLVEAQEDDSFCDIVFHVEDDVFPAHKYFMFSRAPGIRKLCGSQKHVHLELENLSSKMFELILKYVYSHYQLTMADVEDIEISLSPLNGLDNLEVFSVFREFCGRFGMPHFATMSSNADPTKTRPAMRLNRKLLPELHDVTIQCADKQSVSAHKCVLISRMEYFRFMFTSSNWAETKLVNWRTLSAEYVAPLIDFLYDNDVQALYDRNYSDVFICNMLVICDQYFVSELCAVFERMLIERLTIRKAVVLFEFAGNYNRETLRQASLDFMVANIERMLEHQQLVGAEPDVIAQVCDRYLELLPSSVNTHRAGRLGRTVSKFGNDLDYDDAWDDAKMENMIKDFDVNINDVGEVGGEGIRRKKERKTSDSQQERIQMEKEAIEAMKAMSLEEDDCRSNASTSSSITSDADKLPYEIPAPAKHWTRVTEKKEPRNKLSLAGLKANEILAAEKREDDDFVSLNKLSFMCGASFDSNSDDGASNGDEFFERSPISLASFSPQKPMKLSQKQRKNLSKIGNTSDSEVRPGSPPAIGNPWSTNTPPSSSHKTPDFAKSPSPSFFDVKPAAASNSMFDSPRSARSQPASPSMASSPADVPTSKSMDNFVNIVRKEQREKNYFHKLRNKSLALTLLEERAIDELKKFYNVENTFDERITVERIEALQPTMNFAKWDLEK